MKACHMLVSMGLVSTVAALVLTGAAILSSRPAQATAPFAQQTGLPCARCHAPPVPAGPLTPFGQDFKNNGNRVKK